MKALLRLIFISILALVVVPSRAQTDGSLGDSFSEGGSLTISGATLTVSNADATVSGGTLILNAGGTLNMGVSDSGAVQVVTAGSNFLPITVLASPTTSGFATLTTYD